MTRTHRALVGSGPKPWALVVPLALVLAAEAAAAPEARSGKALVEVLAPSQRQVVDQEPIAASVRFNRPIRPGSFRAWLNLENVTARFTVTATGAEAVLGPDDGLLRQGRRGRPRARNVLLVSVRSTDRTRVAEQRVFFFDDSVPVASAEIPPEGGSITLPDHATVSFPAGAFAVSQPVALSATRSPETAMDWQASAPIFAAGGRTVYELRLNSGIVGPQTSWQAVIAVPADFASQLPADSEIQVMAQVFQDGGEEVLDHFELFESTYSAAEGTVTVTLPSEAFTNHRRADETYEAVILLATTPTRPTPVAPLRRPLSDGSGEEAFPPPPDAVPMPPAARLLRSAATGTCRGSSLGPPLADRHVTSAYDGKTHYGTDYRANDGTEVLAMADGTIEWVGFDERPLPKPDPRSGKMVKGWGHWILVKHQDGSRSIYAHLQPGLLVDRTKPVKKGDPIALSDNSGGSSAPHLHVEYAPNGKIFEKPSKADADACVDENVTGSITVSDNGSAADDAFSVAINGLVVCTTAVGATNTCAVGNLRPGTATLTITAVVAPDDVGTYLITLAAGLTFADGTTDRSGTLPQGASTAFSIHIPVPIPLP